MKIRLIVIAVPVLNVGKLIYRTPGTNRFNPEGIPTDMKLRLESQKPVLSSTIRIGRKLANVIEPKQSAMTGHNVFDPNASFSHPVISQLSSTGGNWGPF